MELIGTPLGLLAIAGALYGAIGLVALFVGLERRDRSEVVIGIIVGALFAQLTFHAVDARVPVGPFRPGPLRLPEILIGTALVARWWTRTTVRTVTPTGLAWLAFAVWTVTGAVIGALNGNPIDVVLFHGKLVVYIGGIYLLAAGVPAARLISRRALGGWLAGLSAVVAVQVVFSFTDLRVLGPVTPAPMGADGASLYFALGLSLLLIEAARRPARLWVVVAAAPMVLGPLAVGQRASVVHLAGSVAVVAMVMVGPSWRRKMVVRPTQLLLGAMFVLAVGCLLLIPGLPEGEVVPVPVSQAIESTFGGVGNSQSSDARTSKWDEGVRMVRARPLLGWGLGVQHEFFQPGINGTGEFREGGTFDNIVFDLSVRSGVPGLLLFGLALWLSMRDAWTVWLRHADPRVAAMGLAAMSFIAGLVAKGAVESILEKVVLACAFGLAIGMIASARAEADDDLAAVRLALSSVERPDRWN